MCPLILLALAIGDEKKSEHIEEEKTDTQKKHEEHDYILKLIISK